MNRVLEVIKNRRSIRKYLPDQIKQEELDLILEAGSYAPSAHNHQPWHFMVIQNKEFIDNMSVKSKEIMATQPTDWIQNMGKNENLNIFYNAPTVIVVSGKEDAIAPLVDCSAAIQNMMLAAESLNIGSCWIGLIRFFFGLEEAKKLNIPQGYTPYYAVCLGYKAVDQDLNGPKREENIVSYIK